MDQAANRAETLGQLEPPTHETAEAAVATDAWLPGMDELAPAPAEPPAEAPSADLIPGEVPLAYNADVVPMGRVHRKSPRGLIAVVMTAVLLAGALVYVNLGPGGSSADAAVYERVFIQKQTNTYDFRMEMTAETDLPGEGGAPLDMAMNMRLTERVLSVDDDGTALVRSTVDRLRATVGGQTMSLPTKGMAVTARIASDGRVLAVDGLAGFGLGETGSATDLIGPQWMGPLLPSGAVAPGDTWTVRDTFPMPFGDQALTVTARNKLLKLRDVDGRGAAVIQSSVSVPMQMRVSMADMLEAMPRSIRGQASAGMPRDLAFAYDGEMTMDLVQTVDRVTSAPLSVTGTGQMDVGMTMSGGPGPDQRIAMVMDFRVSMNEV